MAKRKAATARKGSARARGRSAAARKGSARKTARKAAAGRKPAARKAASRKTSARSARKAASRKGARKAAPRKAAVRRAVVRKAVVRKAVVRKAAKPSTRTITARPTAARSAETVIARKVPALDRVRRTAPDDDVVPSPPSSLDLDRSASAVRTGRRELRERYEKHTETSPALTAGDVDADWESAYSVGDEAPGGDNPTPDQDIVDDIGRAVGNEYQDTEELKGADKITKRDKHRWELDPASSEDYDDRK